MARLILVANRLPVTIEEVDGKLNFQPSSGGLATGLKSLEGEYEKLWIGWSGLNTDDTEKQKEIDSSLDKLGMKALSIDDALFQKYYYGYSNETIWPLFHYFSQFVINDEENWKAYKEVNEIFAAKIIEVAEEGDIIWVQDYQLMLVPQLIRKHFKKTPIGFFLHIPFPSYELFRTLPHREELLEGMLGADLVGFHTYDYIRHFNSSISRILGYSQHYLGRVSLNDRVVDVESFPMGINFDKYADAVETEGVQREVKKLKEVFGDQQTILSIDRLDYSKGVTQRLKGFELFLDRYPEYWEKISLQMVLVPSRDSVSSYANLKDEIDKMVGYINGKYGTLQWNPVNYYYRSVDFNTLIALYHLAPIALITPFRDGMNLVSKEYVAAKKSSEGVLILSEMAGAAKELTPALSVNPNNLESIVKALYEALNMSSEEKKKRMNELQKIVQRNNVNEWGKHFIDHLLEVRKVSNKFYGATITPDKQGVVLSQYKKAEVRLIFLDYDGTLVNFTSDPSEAKPSPELLDILEKLTSDFRNKVIIISGRKKESLDEWLGHFKLDLVAEHGAWTKLSKQTWRASGDMDTSWKKELHELFLQFIRKTAGSFEEEKSYSLAWHYRNVDPMLADIRKHELIEKLNQFIGDKNLNLQEGNKVIEVKPQSINKGAAARKWLDTISADFIMAIGDDFTDEDTFRAMPKEAFTIKVGLGDTDARYKIESVDVVHNLLKHMTEIKS